jgi:hypothetical protein
MHDGVIKPATNISKHESTGRIYFDVDGKMYRYLTFVYDHESSRPWNRRILIPANSFQQFIHEDWYETRQIEYFIALDEEENEELNYFQSTDFNAGVFYSAIEKATSSMIKEETFIKREFIIPAIQLIPKNCSFLKEEEIIKATANAATTHFDAVYGKSFSLDITSWLRVKQYVKFDYTVTRKECYKEMTVADIEEALGYKIKVVGEK